MVAGQCGLYAGTQSDRTIRGGLLRQFQSDTYWQFLVNNDGGKDSNLGLIGLISTGDVMRLTLQQIAGKYSLVIENQIKRTTSTLTIVSPASLDGERDLDVGIFGANPGADVRKTLTIKELSVPVWTVSSEDGPTAHGAG